MTNRGFCNNKENEQELEAFGVLILHLKNESQRKEKAADSTVIFSSKSYANIRATHSSSNSAPQLRFGTVSQGEEIFTIVSCIQPG